MTLSDALEQTGCAIQRHKQVVTAVEHIVHDHYLLMVRRGVSVLAFQQGTFDEMLRLADGKPTEWQPATIAYVTFR